MNLPLHIAVRYLFARKSHNVINIISAISAIGLAIGTAALVIILSVYNGFGSIVSDSLSDIDPDILVTASKGKYFVPDSEAFDWAYDQESVLSMCSILEETVYISYDGHSGVARARGVDKIYEEESPLANHITEGKFTLHKGSVPLAAVGVGLAYSMDINPRFVASIDLYYPARDRKFSVSAPTASLETESVWPSGLFSVNSDADANLMIVPLQTMRDLLGCTSEVSGIELRVRENISRKEFKRLMDELSSRLGEDFVVRDRVMQNESLFKMMKYEKAAIWLILTFVVIVIAFNIFGSLSMLMIEKKDDIRTLASMGATDGLIRRIFVTEGWLISLLGLAAGLAGGTILALLQQRFGIIKMPGGFAAAAYPVILKGSDIAVTGACIALIGYIIALLPAMGKISGEDN